MNTQCHTIIKYQDTDNCLSASLVAQKIALKSKISIHITSNVFTFDMTYFANDDVNLCTFNCK